MQSNMIPENPPTGQLLTQAVDSFLNQIQVRDVPEMAESFNSQREGGYRTSGGKRVLTLLLVPPAAGDT